MGPVLGALWFRKEAGVGAGMLPHWPAPWSLPVPAWAGVPVPFTGVQAVHFESQVAVSSGELLEGISPCQRLSALKTFEARCQIALESLCAHLCPRPQRGGAHFHTHSPTLRAEVLYLCQSHGQDRDRRLVVLYTHCFECVSGVECSSS